MSGAGSGFKRMVVGLPQGAANEAAVVATADLAEFLNIELRAAFVADTALPALAALSGGRELLTLEQGWRELDRAQIMRDVERAVGVARRCFAASVKTRAIKSGFDVLTGAEAMAALIRADDIVALIEPAHPGERITWPFTGLLAAAFAAAGAVLAVPARIARTTGPIVAQTLQDAGIRAALEIAAASRERLIVVTAAEAQAPRWLFAEAARRGVALEHIAGGEPPPDALPFAAVGRWRERLRVLSRRDLTEDSLQLFSALRGVPILMVGPDRAKAPAAK